MKRTLFRLIGFIFLIFFTFLTLRYFDADLIGRVSKKLITNPTWLIAMFVVYGLAFVLRALAWKWYLNQSIPLSVYLYALFYSLFINHLLPLKVGDAVRVGLLIKEKKVQFDETLHSVVVMRLLDMLILGLIANVGALFIGFDLSIGLFLIVLTGLSLGLLLFYWLSKRMNSDILRKHWQMIQQAFSGTKGIYLILFITLSWLFETIVVFGVTMASGLSLSFLDAIWVNSLTISTQVFHFTPGGIGNYESMMSFALSRVGLSWEEAYSIALVSHGFKFFFSYLVGLYVLFKYPIRISELKKWLKINEKGANAE
ncbi:MAG: YbhN family protein [Tepidibacillus sp.]